MDPVRVRLLNECVLLLRPHLLKQQQHEPPGAEDPDPILTTALRLCSGDFEDIIDGCPIMKVDASSSASPFSTFPDRLSSFLSSSSDSHSAFLRLQFLATSLLLICVRENYTGPVTKRLSPSPFLTTDDEKSTVRLARFKRSFSTAEKESDRQSREALSSDGELLYSTVTYPQYFHAAKIVFDVLSRFLLEKEEDEPATTTHCFFWWWKMRFLRIWQEFLLGSSPTIQQSLFSIATDNVVPGICGADFSLASALEKEEEGEEINDHGHSDSDDELLGRLFVEIGYLYSMYLESETAMLWFSLAKKVTGLSVKQGGARGRKSLYGRPRPVQVCDANSRSSEEEQRQQQPPAANVCLPETIPYPEGCNYLQKIEFAEGDPYPESQKPLRVVDQTILLALCADSTNSNPSSGLTKAITSTYVDRVLMDPNDWAVQFCALLLKSRPEFEKYETLQTALAQINSLVDLYSDPADKTSSTSRMRFVFSLQMPAMFKLAKELAQKYLKAGDVRIALGFFEYLECYFEEIVQCCLLLGQEYAAISTLKKRLETDPENPLVWCLLGEIEEDPECFQKSWEFSAHKDFKPMYLLGKLLIKCGKYQEAIAPLEACLGVSSVNLSAWFLLGTASLNVEDWPRAAKAFTHVVQLNPRNGEGWANLAIVNVKTDRLRTAHVCLSQALKMREKNPVTWYKYLELCMRLGEYNQAILAVRKIAGLNLKMMNWEIVQSLVNVIRTRVEEVSEMPDDDGKPSVVEEEEEGEEEGEDDISPQLTLLSFDDDERVGEEEKEEEDESLTVLTKTEATRRLEFLKRQLGLVFGFLSSLPSLDPIFWDIFGDYNVLVGDFEEALRCRKEYLKSLKCPDWFRREQLVASVVGGLESLHETLRLAGQPVVEMKDGVEEIMGIIRLDYDGEDEYERLQALMSKLSNE